MVKGRGCAPVTADGSWYSWRGHAIGKQSRLTDTTSGSMLNDIHAGQRPRLPPREFRQREATQYDLTHKFTSHDNRNAFQNSGEYFGQGLGRRSCRSSDARLHHSQTDLLHHKQADEKLPTGTTPMPDFHSEYAKNYKGFLTETPTTKRRFAKDVEEVTLSGIVRPTTSTIDWQGPGESTTAPPTELLAQTQRFVTKATPKWTYSFKAK